MLKEVFPFTACSYLKNEGPMREKFIASLRFRLALRAPMRRERRYTQNTWNNAALEIIAPH